MEFSDYQRFSRRTAGYPREAWLTYPALGLAGEAGLLRLGLPDRYVTHGKPALLREEVGLTPAAIAERVAQAVLDPHALQSA